MRRIAALMAFLLCTAGTAAAAARYEVTTVQSLDGTVSVMRDTSTGMVTFLPVDPGLAWRVLEGPTLATYANGEPATVFVFHPPFDPWTWLDYWYGFEHADVEAALARTDAAATKPLRIPPLDAEPQVPEPYDFFGTAVRNAVAAEPFRFAFAGRSAGGLPLWNVYISRLDDPESASIVVEYTRSRNSAEVAVETLPRAAWSVRAWRGARPLTRAHGIPFRYGDGQIYGRSRADWVVVHGTGSLTRRQRVAIARSIRFR